MDVETLMRAIGALHSGRVVCEVSPLGIGFGTGVAVNVKMMFDVLPGSSLPQEVCAARDWPCDQHGKISAHVFALLYELDYKISQVYQNEALWK
jgi:hypothetical protein